MQSVRDVAVEICRREGGAVNLPVAQVMEVVRHTREVVLLGSGVDIYAVLRKTFQPTFKVGDRVEIVDVNIEIKDDVGEKGIIKDISINNSYPYKVLPNNWDVNSGGIWCTVKKIENKHQEKEVRK